VCAYICALVHVFKKSTFGALQIAEFSNKNYIVFYMHKISGFLGASVQSDRDTDRDRKKWTGTVKGLEGKQEKGRGREGERQNVLSMVCDSARVRATRHASHDAHTETVGHLKMLMQQCILCVCARANTHACVHRYAGGDVGRLAVAMRQCARARVCACTETYAARAEGRLQVRLQHISKDSPRSFRTTDLGSDLTSPEKAAAILSSWSRILPALHTSDSFVLPYTHTHTHTHTHTTMSTRLE